MTPTPRTDAIAHQGLGSVAYIAQMTSLGRELERELAAKDSHADEIYKASVDLAAKLEDDLAACREWSSKLADFADDLRADLATEREQLAANHEATRLMGKWLEAERELADRLAGVLLSYDSDMLAGHDMEWLPEHDETLAAWKEARRAQA